ncbi:MAG: DUF2267 domain-containing protein [Methyloceanibacter sp.]|jgi:uncharacterized protein (DUF2267 family)
MTTGLDVFDTTVQETNLWLKELMERLGTYDRHRAYSTLRAVLHVLRDRIGPANAIHLGAQLPMLVRGLYYEGWHMGGTPTKERHEAEFIAHVSRELPRADEAEIEDGIRAVFGLLAKKLDFGEVVKVAGVLPKELRERWPVLIQEAVQTKQAGAA